VSAPRRAEASETATLPWPLGPARPVLLANEVHIWLAAVDRVDIRRLVTALSLDEQERATRFRHARDRHRYLVSRGGLRVLLGNYLGQTPEKVELTIGPHGKPALAASTGGDLRFNLSHTGDYALLAFANHREVGIDLEQIRPIADLELLSTTVLSPREQAIFASLPDAGRIRFFFDMWTRKEAYVKALGVGLGRPFTTIEVITDDSGRITMHDPAEMVAGAWTLRSLDPAPGYVAALAVVGEGWRLRCWRWPAAAEEQLAQ
jgi:4'-phosphopantetheinyl transferase